MELWRYKWNERSSLPDVLRCCFAITLVPVSLAVCGAWAVLALVMVLGNMGCKPGGRRSQGHCAIGETRDVFE